jgi:peptidoglycan/xylan/chitin deacetylase (PgdA/CDA1 family)
MTSPSRLRRVLLRAFGRPFAFASAQLLRLTARRVGLAFVYHAVGQSTGNPARELVPPHGIGLFEAQLRHLKRAYRVVPASELLLAVQSRRRGQRIPVAITFDDDLKSHRELAVPALTHVGVPATFYLCGGSLEEPFSYWWERLQVAYDRGLSVPLPVGAGIEGEAGIGPLAAAIQRLEPGARDHVAESLRDALGPDPYDAGMRGHDVTAVADAGFEIGFHTLRHHALPQLEDAALRDALDDGRARLESLIGRPITTIAYPHGRADERAASATRAAGFRVGFTTRSGVATPADDPLLVPRLNPSFESAGHFAVQAARALSAGG